jgi:hypothetical protein
MGFGCSDMRSRPTRAGEPRLAQEIAFYLFAKDFKDRHDGGVFTSERAYLWEKDPQDLNSQLIFEMMYTFFRNWVPPSRFKKDPSTRREGGQRKPDGMGISPKKGDGSIVTELIEVKPVDNPKDGETQMRDMLSKLNDGMKGYIEEQRALMSFDPGIRAESYKFIGSPFIPSSNNLLFPLTPLNIQSPTEMNWICYKPTLAYRRPLGQFSPIVQEREGVILYEIHTIDLRQSKDAFDALPVPIRQSIQHAFVQAVRRNRADQELRLVPWAPDAFARNAAAKQKLREQMLLLGAAMVVGVILLCVFAPPAGAAAAGVVGGEVASLTAAETSAVAVEEVFVSYRVAPMVRVAGQLMRYEEVLDPVSEVASDVIKAVQ